MKTILAGLLAAGLAAGAFADEHPKGKGNEHPTAGANKEHPAPAKAAKEHSAPAKAAKEHSAPAKAAKEHSAPAKAEATFKGEVLDLVCFLGHGAKGKDHAKCAQKCLLEGAPAGLLTEDEQVYLLIADHGKEGLLEKVKKNGGKTVTVTGKVLKNGGLQAIQVATVEK